MHELKKMLMKELMEYEKKGELSAGSLEAIHKLTDTIKNIDKIEMLEGEEGYSSAEGINAGMWPYEEETSGANRRGSNYVRGYYRGGRGGYSREGGSSGESYEGGGGYSREGGSSYAGRGGGGGGNQGGYSRADGKERMIEKLEEMMRTAENDRQRETIRNCIRQMENI